MPAIPIKSGANPCADHGCAACCHETEMVLSEADITRLAGLGHARDAFMEVDAATGYAILRNVETDAGRHCFFLKDGACSVYAHRPEGCRWYPVTVTPERRITKDDDCPHRGEFRGPPDAQRQLVKLLGRLEREARKRR